MSPIPPITLAQCQANNAAPPTGGEVTASDKPATSPGIFARTASPSPVPASGQKTDRSLEASARSAVDALIEETSKPPADQDAARVEALTNKAICAAQAYLNQVNPSDRKSLAYASRLVGEAHGTSLGLAQRAEDIALNKYSILFKMTQGLESRLKDPQGSPLTEQEKKVVDRVIEEARNAAERNVVAWTGANAIKLDVDARICTSGLTSAEETLDLVLISAAKAERLVNGLDQRTLQRETGSR